MQFDLIPSLVGVIVAMGGGAGMLKLIEGVIKIRSGMSAKESSRKVDIITQRDLAIKREMQAWSRVDAEAEKRRRVQEYASQLRGQLLEARIDPEPEPVLEQTITKAQLTELRETEKP